MSPPLPPLPSLPPPYISWGHLQFINTHSYFLLERTLWQSHCKPPIALKTCAKTAEENNTMTLVGLVYGPIFSKPYLSGVEDVVTSWLVHSALDQVVQVQALAETLSCVLKKTLYFHSASFHPGVKWVPVNVILEEGGGTLRWNTIPYRRGVEILPNASMLQKPHFYGKP